MKSVSAETLDPSFRLESHFQSQLNSNGSMVDRIFASLMLLQYVGCVIAALIVTPNTWAGTEYSIHFHVWTAVLFGGLLAIPTAISGLARSGARLNQYAFAVSQMLFSSLIIHLSGGRLESHFHIFGSIAFLAAYRDPRVILVATVVTAVDHFARALMWPHSLYGLDYVSLWRPIEHAAWVVFEDVILLFMIYKIRQEMWSISKLVQTRAQHQDSLKTELDKLRTAIAAAANGDLTVAVDSSQLEETEGLSADLKRMLADMRQMISNINQKSITVRARAEQFAHRTETIRESIESQRSSIDSIETAMNSMKDTISNIHESTDLVRAAKSEAREKAELSELAIAASERSMSELQSSSHRIDSIVEEIREIAEQTTLLSLNATIEAARAGESGKGFAVVASEVKDLARKANVAANRISELIKESLHRVDEGVSSSKKVTEQFRGIIDAVQSIDKTIADVVSATSLQAEQTQQVDVLVQEVLESSHQSAESCRSVSLDSQSFREIAEHLDQEVNRFSIGDTADMRA